MIALSSQLLPWFGHNTRSLGEQLCGKGSLRIDSTLPDRIKATIAGGLTCRVALARTRDGAKAFCTCPAMADSKRGCRHLCVLNKYSPTREISARLADDDDRPIIAMLLGASKESDFCEHERAGRAFRLTRDLLAFDERAGIRHEAWSPLVRGRGLSAPAVMDIAKKHGKTPAQVILRRDLQKGVVTIPKSIRRERILENSRIFDFQLAASEMHAISALENGTHIGPHPDNVNF